VFLMYAAVCVVAVVFVKFGVPETTGQALESLSAPATPDTRTTKLIMDATPVEAVDVVAGGEWQQAPSSSAGVGLAAAS